MSDSIVVAVRCRPFNKREQQLGAKCIVDMTAKSTTVTDPDNKSEPKKFTFDYSYWSFDDTASNFATNKTVYGDVGNMVLNNALQGYNCCLFAYGQTGSGKSYSMVGYGDDKGVVPLVLQNIFISTEKNTDKNVKYLVEASMMEIYNEKVRDLFNPKSNTPAGLKIRDHPQTGPYVDGLSRSVVRNYAEIEKLMDQGTAARTVASTQMNATSSRAHTVFQIVFTTTVHDDITNKDTSKTSKINLVDLAGSERIAKTGASGATLKEGININKSLSSLGDCIEKLAARSKNKNEHVPYRNSVLTWILKESLGGNSRSIMIAAISPADDNYDETLSTLRYADRAKQIKNKAIVNEDENAKIIRQLRDEILALRQQLEMNGGGRATVNGGGMSGMTDEERAEYMALKEQMKQNELLISNMNMTFEEKLKQTNELALSRAEALGREMADELVKKKKQQAHMVNLHKDRLMSQCLHYFFPLNQTIRVCQKTAVPAPTEDDIIVNGLQIKTEHATITNKKGVVTITPQPDARVYVNGVLAKSAVELHHSDRLILGAHLVFKVILPNHAVDEKDTEVDWDFAQKELTQSNMSALMQGNDNVEEQQKLDELKAAIQAEKQAAETERVRHEKEYQQQIEQMNAKRESELAETKKRIEETTNKQSETKLRAQLQQREDELEREKLMLQQLHQQQVHAERQKQLDLEKRLNAQLNETEKLKHRYNAEMSHRSLLEEQLMNVIPMCNEANEICKELEQLLRFSIKLHTKHTVEIESTEIMIRVIAGSDAEQLTIDWHLDFFVERLYLMREIYNYYLMTGVRQLPADTTDNPFQLDFSAQRNLLGSCRLYLQPLYYLLPINEQCTLIDYKGAAQGQLHVSLVPLQSDYDELTEVLNQPFTVELTIEKCMGLPMKLCKNVNVSYQFMYDVEQQSTEVSRQSTINPAFHYKRTIVVSSVTQEFINYINTNVLEFSVYAAPVTTDEFKTTMNSRLTSPVRPERQVTDDHTAYTGSNRSSSDEEYMALQNKYEHVVKTIAKLVRYEENNIVDKPEILVDRVQHILDEQQKSNESNAQLTTQLNNELAKEQSLLEKNKLLEAELDTLLQQTPKIEYQKNIKLRRTITNLTGVQEKLNFDGKGDHDEHGDTVDEPIESQEFKRLNYEINRLKSMSPDEIRAENEKLKNDIRDFKRTSGRTEMVAKLQQRIVESNNETARIKQENERNLAELQTLRLQIKQTEQQRTSLSNNENTQPNMLQSPEKGNKLSVQSQRAAPAATGGRSNTAATKTCVIM